MRKLPLTAFNARAEVSLEVRRVVLQDEAGRVLVVPVDAPLLGGHEAFRSALHRSLEARLHACAGRHAVVWQSQRSCRADGRFVTQEVGDPLYPRTEVVGSSKEVHFWT